MIRALAEGNGEKAMKTIMQHVQTSQRERLQEYSYWEREALIRHEIQDFFHDDDMKETPEG